MTEQLSKKLKEWDQVDPNVKRTMAASILVLIDEELSFNDDQELRKKRNEVEKHLR